MNATLKVAVVAAVALAIGIGALELRPVTTDVSSAPSSSPTLEPAPLLSGPLPAGAYVTTPFAHAGSDACLVPPQASCIDGTDDDAIRITFTVPDGWYGNDPDGVTWPSDTERAALILVRGASLAADPCHNDGTGDIPVGPSVINFERALREQPLLSVTDAIDTTLGGRPARYMELQVPDDPTIQGSPGVDGPGCPVYRPWNPWYLAQDPGELWHLWIVDVDGVRVVVQAIDTGSTSAEVKAQLQGIVDSVRIERPVDPAESPAPASLSWSLASLEQDWPAPVRTEPEGSPMVVPNDGGTAPDAADFVAPAYHDPVGDVGSSAPSWIDITAVNPGGGLGFALGSILPPVPDPAESWIAYGLVLDEDRDGVADVRIGVDNLPAGAGHRAWRTDLRTGRTEFAVGAPYGRVGDRFLDTFYADDGGPTFFGLGLIRFYAWASLIQDGRVVATDYAPDSGWLDSVP